MNNTSSNTSKTFEKSLESLRQVTLAPEKKEAVFNTLSRYVEAHPPVTDGNLYVALVRMLRSVFTTISWK